MGTASKSSSQICTSRGTRIRTALLLTSKLHKVEMGGRVWLVTLLLAGSWGFALCQSDVCLAPDGRDGVPGTPGRDGREGEKGERGHPGAPGRNLGLTENKGETGNPGASGGPGPIGYKGPQGPPGPPGEMGPKGAKGPMADTANQRRPAFSASNPQIKGNLVLFSRPITNVETSYKTDTGKFVCSDPGYYYFTFQVMSSGDLCLYIVKNGGRLLGFCDTSAKAPQHQVNSGGTVLNLRNKDEVWIETDAQKKNIATTADITSVFSGFLLFPH
ncbi:complement C1q subcomponent subunit A [Xenopus laevis]|uniref:C1q domain-containing protein n=2 Tax=Xenopus laevis TaxID=8355 RepID=A0AA97PZG1_XENLA|nr:complement C1q subcomponent subunit A [Xenopus laevis]OCT56944.1 hypothetical protein XELAEV_18004183mg [Xenopus laevis]